MPYRRPTRRTVPVDEPGLPIAGAAEATTGASVARGGAWNAIGVIAPQINALIISIVAAHHLGADAFGRQSFIAFIELSVVFILTDSIYTAVVRSVGAALGSGRSAALHALIRWAWWVEGVAAVFGGGILVATAIFGAGRPFAWVLAGLATAFGILNATPGALLVGMQRWRSSSTMWVLLSVAAAVSTIVVLLLGGGITGMFAVEAVASAAHLVWATILVRRIVPPVASPAAVAAANPVGLRRDAGRYARSLLPQAVLLVIVTRRSELFFLDAYSPERELALYSIPFAFVVALTRIPTSMAFALVPAIATLDGAERMDRIRAGVDRGTRLLLLATLPLVGFAVALGPRFLQLVYGDQYHGTGIVLLILLASLPFSPFNGLGVALASGLGRARALVAANTLAAIADLGLAALLVAGHGAVGAATANAAGQITFAVVLVVFRQRWIGLFRTSQWLTIGRAAVAAAGVGGVAWLAARGVAALDLPAGRLLSGVLALAGGALAGALALLVLAWALRIVPREDVDWLDERFGRVAGGRAARFARRCALHPAP